MQKQFARYAVGDRGRGHAELEPITRDGQNETKMRTWQGILKRQAGRDMPLLLERIDNEAKNRTYKARLFNLDQE
jgi:hypothetical protein